MNRTARMITLAAPLATVALSLGISPALAEPAGPALDTISSAPAGPVNPHLPVDPQGPVDKVALPVDPDPEPQPDPQPGPQGPDDKVSIPEPCPTHGPCGDQPDDKKGPNDEDEPGDDDSSTGDEIDRPTRIDAGSATNDAGTVDDDLAWLLTGGVLIAMTGAAYAARRRDRSAA